MSHGLECPVGAVGAVVETSPSPPRPSPASSETGGLPRRCGRSRSSPSTPSTRTRSHQRQTVGFERTRPAHGLGQPAPRAQLQDHARPPNMLLRARGSRNDRVKAVTVCVVENNLWSLTDRPWSCPPGDEIYQKQSSITKQK